MKSTHRDHGFDVAIVGSGPNGLAAAVLFARAGLKVALYEAAAELGGGTRTSELVAQDVWHDVCSGVHPLGLASPFFRAFDLGSHGVTMLMPNAAYAHPVDGGVAGVAWKDIDRTADSLGVGGTHWRRLLAPLVAQWPAVVDLALGDMRHVRPMMSTTAVRFGLRIPALQIPWLRRSLARDLFTGVAMHAGVHPGRFAARSVGLLLATLGHAIGWPVPRGGSRAIIAALERDLRRHDVAIYKDCPVRDLREVLPARVVVLNLGPARIVQIGRRVFPRQYMRRLARFRYGAGVCKVDVLVDDPVPWAAAGCNEAGTLHLIGTRAEALAAVRMVAAGGHPPRPYVLVTQPGVVDDTRAPAGQHTLSAYCHVPNGSSLDMTQAILGQIERFAPGFRCLVRGSHVFTASDLGRYNENYVGGDIMSGRLDFWQTARRPRPSVAPYTTPLPDVYHCSAATPPGPGVHGMAGVQVARLVLRRHFGYGSDPLDLLPSSRKPADL